MRVGIDVNNRSEGDAIRRAIEEPVLKTTAVVTGALLELPSMAQRRAVIRFLLATVVCEEAPDADRDQLRLHYDRGNGRDLADTGE